MGWGGGVGFALTSVTLLGGGAGGSSFSKAIKLLVLRSAGRAAGGGARDVGVGCAETGLAEYWSCIGGCMGR